MRNKYKALNGTREESGYATIEVEEDMVAVVEGKYSSVSSFKLEDGNDNERESSQKI